MSAPREELQAAIEARRELGREHEDELVESFLARIEGKLEQRRTPPVPAKSDDHHAFVLALVSLGVAIPMLGIAGGIAGLAGIIAVCVALVVLNAIVWKGSSGTRR